MKHLPILLAIASLAAAQTYKISTVAGGGPLIGQDALATSINSPEQVAADANGNIYVASPSLAQVYKFDSTGKVAQVIGTGFAGSSGDGGVASSAWIGSPSGVAIDSLGNVYISDATNNVIRKVDGTTGLISTLAGLSLTTPLGLAVDAANNLYIANSNAHTIVKITPAGVASVIAGTNGVSGLSGDSAAATSAKLNTPVAVALDSAGNLYIADCVNNRIRKVTAGIISTFAGTTGGFAGDGAAATAAHLNSPRGVAVDSANNVYIGDNGNSVVREVTAADGKIATIAGKGSTSGFGGDGGSATSTTARLNVPRGVAIDSAGNLWISDTGNSRIRKVTSGIINTAIGNGAFSGDGGPGINAQLAFPDGVAIDSSRNIYIADSSSARIRKLTAATGIITTVAGGGTVSTDGGQATAAKLMLPVGVAVDASGNLYIADKNNSKIRKVNTSGVITTYAGTGTGGFTGDNGAATLAQINQPQGVAVDSAGNLYFTNVNRIRKVDTTGTITTIAGTGTASYSGDGSLASNALLNGPAGLCTDSAGNLYIADTLNSRVRKIDFSSGNITLFAGTGAGNSAGDGKQATLAGVNGPTGCFVDTSGNVFIAEKSGNRIRKVAPGGVISTFAGNGTAGFSGDGGAPTSANLNAPFGVTGDTSGTIWLTENVNYRVRMINAAASVVIASSPTGSSVVVDGNTVTTPQTFLWDSGSSHTLDVPTVPGGAGTQKAFSSWSQGGAAAQTIVVPAAGGTYTATLTTQYQLTLAASPANDGTISPASGTYFDAGSSVSVTATPNAGFNFGSWTGPANDSASAATTVTMSQPQSLTATFTPSAATVTLGNLTATYDGTQKAATATTDPPSLNISFMYTGVGGTNYPASATPPIAAGSYNVTAAIASDTYSGSASGTLVISPAAATISLSGLAATYDGSPKAAAATTNPAGVSVTLTYTGTNPIYGPSSTPPSAAGSYQVNAALNNPNYSGQSASGTLTISPANLTVSLNGLAPTYNGNPQAVTATTSPVSVNTAIMYTGLSVVYPATNTPPTGAGTYSVTATVDAAGYAGSTTGTLTIGKAAAIVTVTNVDVPWDGSAKLAPVVTNPASLNLIVTYNSAGTAPVTAGLYNVLATVNDANYLGSGAGTVNIRKINPVLTWASPAAITFGSALGAGQLNATANVPGVFTYTPAAGTVLPVGNGQALSVSFTPTDSADYNAAIAGTTINVNPAASGPAQIAITKLLSRDSSNNIVMLITLANNGGSPASNVVLTAAKIGTVSGTPVPQTLGTIAAGASAQVTVTVPGSAGASGAASTATINATFTGGTASSTGRITLP